MVKNLRKSPASRGRVLQEENKFQRLDYREVSLNLGMYRKCLAREIQDKPLMLGLNLLK